MVLYCENIVSDIVLLFLKNIGYCFVFFLKSNIVLGFVVPAQGGKNIVSGIVVPTKEDKNIVWDIVCSIEILGENIGYVLYEVQILFWVLYCPQNGDIVVPD